MYPTFDKIREMAAAGDYKRIPICKELYADSYTPVEMMRILQKASHHCYLLESASQNEVWGRYSFLGYDPSMEITCTDGTLRIRRTDELYEKKKDALETGKAEMNKADALHIEKKQSEAVMQVTHPGDAIRKIIQQYKSPVMDNMPTFTGGLVGYFSYDYIKYSEPKLDLTDEEQQDFRDLDLMLFNEVIAFDHYRQKVLLITGVMTDNLDKSYKRACEKLEEMTKLIKKVRKKSSHQSVSSRKSNLSFQKRNIVKWWKKPSIISTRVISFRLFYQIPCVQKPQAACLTPTECLELRTHPHICFIFPAMTSKSPEHHRKPWRSWSMVS